MIDMNDNKKLYVYMFRSRNKDNKEIKDFKERSRCILEYKENEENIRGAFSKFVSEGKVGEKARLYRSVNSRNEEKIKKELIIRLLDKNEFSTSHFNRMLISAAQQSASKNESKWLFDFDIDDKDLLNDFVCDINNKRITTMIYKTVNGFAIVCEHGFDTKDLMEKWKDYDITLKKDDLLFLDIKTKDK